MLQTLCSLTALTFKCRNGSTEKEKTFREALQSRAWILHCLYTAFGLGQMCLGCASWQSECPSDEDPGITPD